MNDNDPVITPVEFSVSLAEDALLGATAHQFFAMDDDTAIDAFSLNVANSFFQV